jgi:hypothetical protein
MAAKVQRVQNQRILPIRDAREFFLIQDGGQRPGRGTAYHRNRSRPGKKLMKPRTPCHHKKYLNIVTKYFFKGLLCFLNEKSTN